MGEIIINNYPKSSVTEAIKGIRTNLRFSSINNEFKTILVSSSVSNEGKSFISSNLAAAYASSEEKVLIIDFDLRKGRQREIFKLNNIAGLTNLLIDNNWKKNLSNYIVETSYKNISVIPSGTIPPNPSVLLESPKLDSVIEELKSKYDVIIFDTPPVIGLSDTVILSRLSDIVLIVASAKKTTPDMLKTTKKILTNVNANIGGVVLNRFDNEISSRSSY